MICQEYKRYFVQLVNDKGSPIYEVNRRVYNSHRNKLFYTTTSLLKEDIHELNESYDMEGNLINKSGVKESNRVSLRLHLKKFLI